MSTSPIFNRFWAKWPDEDEGPFHLWTTIAMIDGRPEVVGVEMFSVDPVSIPELYSNLSENESRAHFRQVRRSTDTFDEHEERDEMREGRAIGTQNIRLPLGKIVRMHMAPERERAESYLKGEWTTDGALAESVQSAAETIVGAPATPAKKAGRKPKPREDFEDVVRIYKEALSIGANPIEAIMTAKNVSKSCAAKWVWKCRRPPLELLPRTKRGVAASIAEVDNAAPKRKRKA